VIVPKRYVTKVLYKSPGGMPNGLQSTPEGLWVCDQVDPNVMFLLDPATGDSLKEIPTRCLHGSGITRDPYNRVWVSSTFGYELVAYDVESGQEVKAFPTPPGDRSGGAHGVEWHNDELWFNVPVTKRIYRMNPDTGDITGEIPIPGDRAHGLAFDGETIWMADTNRQVLFQLDSKDGAILDAIGVDGPEPHGMTFHNGVFYLCDAMSREVFTLERLPD
jgi:streptogramin lyase